MSVYDKVLIITKPGTCDVTNKIAKKIMEFCIENAIPCNRNISYPACDRNVLVVAIGGDGTMLGAMRESLDYFDSTVWGINTGTLGFLSEEVHGNIIATMAGIGRGFGQIDERMALAGGVYLDGELILSNIVSMNEFVLAPANVQFPLKTEVYINDKIVTENLGSGTLVATSTGSTAMSLSAGGAIVSPSTNIMQIVPILPHTLTSRPVITTGRDTISLKTNLKGARHQEVSILGDGRLLGTVNKSQGTTLELRIVKYPAMVRIYRPEKWDFFNVLREKMKW